VQDMLQSYNWQALLAELPFIGFFLVAMPLLGLLFIGSSRLAARSTTKRQVQRPRMKRHLGKDGLPAFFGRGADYSNALARAVEQADSPKQQTPAANRATGSYATESPRRKAS